MQPMLKERRELKLDQSAKICWLVAQSKGQKVVLWDDVSGRVASPCFLIFPSDCTGSSGKTAKQFAPLF